MGNDQAGKQYEPYIYNFKGDDDSVTKKVTWISSMHVYDVDLEKLMSYLRLENPKCTQINSYDFCDHEIYNELVQQKLLFQEFPEDLILRARSRANPFERIKSLFFLSRAALKLANIDAVTNFMFTNVEDSIHHQNSKGPFFFADVCAGPGGFTEYILWRKSWLYKGFGLTLKGDHDFQLHNSVCASPSSFQPLYGVTGDGDVCCPANIKDFKTKVLFQTDQKGVHFMMSDGGFSVVGNESQQEILSKNIYLCQCLVALEIVRTHGYFVTKMFNVFTRFSVGLIFLMYKCFKEVSIFKPNASRPANGERYLICYDLQRNAQTENITIYLRSVAEKLWKVKDNEDLDVLELVPMEELKNDTKFYDFIMNSNNEMAKNQIAAFKKIRLFCHNPNLVDTKQFEYRKDCLAKWDLPDQLKRYYEEDNRGKEELVKEIVEQTEWLKSPPLLNDVEEFITLIHDSEKWSFCPLYSSRVKNKYNLYYAGSRSKTYRWQNGQWSKVKNLKLSPGTVLFGEIVKETLKLDPNNQDEVLYRQCLHIIDAMYLGHICLTGLNFHERMEKIAVYAESSNPEFEKNRIRIRKKPIYSSESLFAIIKKGGDELSYYHNLPILGINSFEESHQVHSVLFTRTDVPLQQMIEFRVQLFLDDANFRILFRP